MLSRRMRGFSLIEMMIVVALILVVIAFSVMTIRPSLMQNDLTEGYNQTLMALRQARDISVAQRQIYFVTLNNAAVPNSITITQGSTGTVTATYFLPTDVAFVALAGHSDIAGCVSHDAGWLWRRCNGHRFRSRHSGRRKERDLFLS